MPPVDITKTVKTYARLYRVLLGVELIGVAITYAEACHMARTHGGGDLSREYWIRCVS
jgi:hypothetical protein